MKEKSKACSLVPHIMTRRVCKNSKTWLRWALQVELTNMWKCTNPKMRAVRTFETKLGHELFLGSKHNNQIKKINLTMKLLEFTCKHESDSIVPPIII
jgi:hypothetical protein